MIIDFEKFRLAIRPHKDVLREEMYVCHVDGSPADYAEVKAIRQAETNSSKFWGHSSMLIEQAAFWHTQGDEALAQATLSEGLEWAAAERQVINDEVSRRTRVAQNLDFKKSGPWTEMKRVDDLAKLGEEIATVDYPLAKVAWGFKGFDVELGKPEFLNAKANAQAVLVDGLIGVDLTLNRISAPEDLDKKYRPGMRVYFNQKTGEVPEWGGKDIFALGIIRTF